MGWWQISHGKSLPNVTDHNNTIFTNPNPNWWWITVSSKSIALVHWSHPLFIYIYIYIYIYILYFSPNKPIFWT